TPDRPATADIPAAGSASYQVYTPPSTSGYQPTPYQPYAGYPPYPSSWGNAPAQGQPGYPQQPFAVKRISGPLAPPHAAPATNVLLSPRIAALQQRVASASQRRGWRVGIAALAAVLLVILLLGMYAIGVSVGAHNTTGASGGSTGPISTVSQNTTSSSVTSQTAQDLQQAVESVIKKAEPSIVEITSVGGSGEAIGSGVIIRSNGTIVTNDHVVSGYSSYTVTLANGKQYTAQIVGQDAQDDLAVLKINATNLPALAIANSNQTTVGEFAIALGNPLGLQDSSTLGIVSALNRSEDEGQGGTTSVLTGLVQTSAQINPGNSGGALINLQGQLIGIPTLGATNTETGGTADGIGFAIPSNRVAYVANQLITSGKLTQSGQGFLGVAGQDVTSNNSSVTAQSGVLVTGFANDTNGVSPAQQAGVQQGDVITAVDGVAITDQTDLAGAVFDQAPGAKITLTIVRGSNQLTITVTLGERPVS
ncbi:MAG TPA: trypsin-like peptidase domain-containing protein, partial [Ktedonobacterales bacterium]|nr:trypsin-like peptidase domain-containing protein [Ktedonobacterales bacterium]